MQGQGGPPIDLTGETPRVLNDTSMRNVLSIDVGVVNTGVCVVRKREGHGEDPCNYPFEILYWDLVNFNPSQGGSASNITTEMAVSNMVQAFMMRPKMFEGVTDVAIESQAISVPMVKALAGGMQAFFETLSRTGSPLLTEGPIRVHLVHGGYKLKVCKTDDLDTFLEEKCEHGLLPPPFKRGRIRKSRLNHSNAEKIRQKNKKDGIYHALTILFLNKDEDKVTWLSRFSKIDDLCDAFLQGCYVLSKGDQYQRKQRINPL